MVEFLGRGLVSRDVRLRSPLGRVLLAALLCGGVAIGVNPVSASAATPLPSIVDQEPSVFYSGLVFSTLTTGWLILNGEVWRTSDAGAKWVKVYRGPDQPTTLDASGSQTAWMIANRELPSTKTELVGLVRTTDAGQHWVTLGEPPRATLFSIDFTSATIGYALTTRGELLQTLDAGQSWSHVKTPAPVGSVCATSSDTLWIGGANGHVYQRSRGRSSWRESLRYAAVAPPPNEGGTYLVHPLLSCAGTSAIALYDWGEAAGSAQYEVMQTLDGRHWSLRFALNVPGVPTRYHAVDSTIDEFGSEQPSASWILGYCGACGWGRVNMATTHDGVAWKVTRLPVSASFVQATFMTANVGWVVATPASYPPYRNLVVLETSNGGATWHRVGAIAVHMG